MKKILAAGIGGAVGAAVRWILLQIPLANDSFHPIMTLLINVSGSFLLGFVIILFEKKIPVQAEIRVAVTTGFFGGYTTFSTMCKDAVGLLATGNVPAALLYLMLSVFLGLLAAWFGIRLGKVFERRTVKE
jgi:CrcB protein